MKTFYFEGIDSHGTRMSEKRQAIDLHALQDELATQHILVLKIRKIRETSFLKSIRKIKAREIADFTQQLATLIEAGLSAKQSLEIIVEGCNDIKFQQLVLQIIREIENGNLLSQAFKRFPQYFDNTYCEFIHAGELSGQLCHLLGQLSNYQQRLLQFKSKMIKAMYYPITVLIAALLITCGLLLYVIPQFQTVFNNFGSRLPFLTQTVIQLANSLHQHLFLLLTVIFLGNIIFYLGLKRSPRFKYGSHAVLLKIPGIKKIITTLILARWSTVLSTTLSAGVPLVTALRSASDAIANVAVQHKIRQLADQISSGESLFQAMQNCDFFPKRAVQMLAVGENSGALVKMLEKIAKIYLDQLDHLLDNLSKLIEPVIMLVLAVISGVLIIAMYLPIFKIGSVI